MKINKIMKPLAVGLTALVGVCSLASCKFDTDNAKPNNPPTEDLAPIEGVDGNQVNLSITIYVGDTKYYFDSKIIRSSAYTEVSHYLDQTIKNEIRDFLGITLTSDKLYTKESKDSETPQEAKFNNKMLYREISVWTTGEYDSKIYASRLEDFLYKEFYKIEKVNTADETIKIYEPNEENLNVISGKIVDDLFKSTLESENIELGEFTDVQAILNENGTITGHIDSENTYTTRKKFTLYEIQEMALNEIKCDVIFGEGKHLNGTYTFEFEGKPNSVKNKFKVKTVVDGKTYCYEFKTNTQTILEITITDNTTNEKEVYVVYN